ncbi:MAG: diheme cytochrome c-553 [Thermoanaerobaculia bacterium]|nr:diheme cytochrome c-553 [Thermoanaerobaculia bacterium]
MDHEALVERGEYLVMVGGCNDCHTPWIIGPNGPEPDLTRMLSGHPEDLQVGPQIPVPAEAGLWIWAPHNTVWVSDAGIAYAFNLTPDENTGIGIWTEEIFIKTLRTGKHWGTSRDILPPMPWFNYGKMTEEDLKAVWAYLRTIPPVHNRVPDAVVAPPPVVAASAG